MSESCLNWCFLHVRFKDVEALVPAGVSKNLRQPVSIFLRQHRNHIAYGGLKSERLLRWKQLNQMESPPGGYHVGKEWLYFDWYLLNIF